MIPAGAIGEVVTTRRPDSFSQENDVHQGWICKEDMILATAMKCLGPHATATDVLISVDNLTIKPGDRVVVFPIRIDE